jgi:opacity protein-like surface antigen
MNDKWTEDIKKAMADYETAPPEGLLDDIKSEMRRREKPALAVGKPAGKRMRKAVITALAAAAALLLLFILRTETDIVPTEKTISQTQHSRTLLSDKPSAPLIAAGTDSRIKLSGKQFNSRQPLTTKSYGGQNAAAAEPEVTDETQQTVDSNHENKPEQKENKPAATADNILPAPETTFQTRKKHKASPVISTYVGSGGGMSAVSPAILLASADPIGPYKKELSGPNANLTMLKTEPVEKKISHRQPIKIGVSVGYPLSERWGITTGITYSRLVSDMTSTNIEPEYTSTQTLHYIGIPVAATYSLVRGKHFNIYATAGMEAEKMVSGKSKDTFADGTKGKSNNVEEKKLQFSMNAAVGAEYLFTPAISIFLEPGVTHYIDNGSSVVNIYKDKPTNLNLNVGLRINLNK